MNIPGNSNKKIKNNEKWGRISLGRTLSFVTYGNAVPYFKTTSVLNINFCMQYVIMALAGEEGGLSLVTFWNSETLSNSKVQVF